MMDEAIQYKLDKQYKRAIRALVKIIEEYPDYAPAYGLTGAIYFSVLRQPKKALPYFQKTVQLSPKSEMASLGLFHSLWNLDRQYEALEEIKRFQTISHCQDYDEILAEIKEKWLSD